MNDPGYADDETDLESFLRERMHSMMGYALYLSGGNVLIAEDAVAHAMDACFEHYRCEGRVAPANRDAMAWVKIIIIRKVRDGFRRERVRLQALRHLQPVPYDPIDEAVTRAMADQAYRYLRTLKRDHMLAVLLWAEGMDHGEIADLLDMKPSTVGTVIHRTLAKLRRHLGVDAGLRPVLGEEGAQ
jgi:DNA-directed RNA polymerase specialized sigma24 family protein